MITIDTYSGIEKLEIPVKDREQLRNWLGVETVFKGVDRHRKQMVADQNGEIGRRRERLVLKKQSAEKYANVLELYSNAVTRLFKAYEVLEKYLEKSKEWTKTDSSHLSVTGKKITFTRGNVRVSFEDAQAEITIYQTDE